MDGIAGHVDVSLKACDSRWNEKQLLADSDRFIESRQLVIGRPMKQKQLGRIRIHRAALGLILRYQ
ncbi:MAG: hypothetical protein IH914_01565 [candidate division Zixibacteria bacterium]|nr:hypothetical protein [candidate division Zixibacteria bacterium]